MSSWNCHPPPYLPSLTMRILRPLITLFPWSRADQWWSSDQCLSLSLFHSSAVPNNTFSISLDPSENEATLLQYDSPFFPFLWQSLFSGKPWSLPILESLLRVQWLFRRFGCEWEGRSHAWLLRGTKNTFFLWRISVHASGHACSDSCAPGSFWITGIRQASLAAKYVNLSIRVFGEPF